MFHYRIVSQVHSSIPARIIQGELGREADKQLPFVCSIIFYFLFLPHIQNGKGKRYTAVRSGVEGNMVGKREKIGNVLTDFFAHYMRVVREFQHRGTIREIAVFQIAAFEGSVRTRGTDCLRFRDHLSCPFRVFLVSLLPAEFGDLRIFKFVSTLKVFHGFSPFRFILNL